MVFLDFLDRPCLTARELAGLLAQPLEVVGVETADGSSCPISRGPLRRDEQGHHAVVYVGRRPEFRLTLRRGRWSVESYEGSASPAHLPFDVLA